LSGPNSSVFPVSVVILTFNEEANLPACLESVRDWAREMFIVDSGSTDRTTAIAAHFGASLVEHPFETHSRQWDWALVTLPFTTDWVLALDADQRATPELGCEIAGLTKERLSGVDGVFIKRQQWFRGRWIRHGGYYPKYLLKMFRRGKAVIDAADLVDHHFYVRGPTLKLQNDLIEANRKEDDLSFWIDKHKRYAGLLAREEYRWRNGTRGAAIEPSLAGNPDQRILALKNVWRHMPLYVRPFLYFFYRYFLRLGFLDGKQGAIFHFLQAFWFRWLVDITLGDLRKNGTPS